MHDKENAMQCSKPFNTQTTSTVVLLYSGGSRTYKHQRLCSLGFYGALEICILLLLLNGEGGKVELSNSSHSERHFCSLATYCTSKKTLLPRPPHGSATAVV